MRLLLIAFTLLNLFCSLARAQTGSMNYVLSRTYKQTGQPENNVGMVDISIQYIDSLGRPKQQISLAKSTAGTDIVQNSSYDKYGRQIRAYLPHVYAGGGGYRNPDDKKDQSNYYTNNGPQLESSDLSRPYTTTTFENSPLQRVVGIRTPGNRSKEATIRHDANVGNDVTRYIYTSNSSITLTISSSGKYGKGKLTRIITTDENDKVSIEYKDMQDRTICQKVVASSGTDTLITYNVYDDFGQLRAVLQPEFQNESSEANYAFLYEYDLMGRVVARKTPGKATENFVYDKYDRKVMFQDGLQKSKGKWGFIKYDALNRIVVTGEISSTSLRSDWQTIFNSNTTYNESKTTTGIGYTLTNVNPDVTEDNSLQVFYYDDYSFPKASALNYNATAGYYPSALASVKGQPTGNRMKMLPGNGSDPYWLTSVVYYDAEYRSIQQNRELHNLGDGSIERVSTQYKYDLAPIISQRKTEHLRKNPVITTTHIATYTYDHADRLLSTKERVTNGSASKEAYTLAQRYNSLGSLKQKWSFSAASGGIYFRTRTDITNNIRGWQTSAKTYYKKTGSTADQPFLTLGQFYANGTSYYTNGNLSSVQWARKGSATYTAGASFSYDGANRFVNSTGLNDYTHLETDIEYDKNGNILSMSRAGAATDNLTYTYTGNRLMSLQDISGSNTGVKNATNTYAYDSNGNMTKDDNRSISLVEYSQANMPMKIIKGSNTFYYDYDASGIKHQYTTDTITLKYEGIFGYKETASGDVLDRVELSNGQAVYDNGVLTFQYYLQDYLGNTRTVFEESGNVIQQTDYYPFGLAIDKSDPAISSAAINSINRYNFLGREKQASGGYIDLKKRFYDPSIGRFLSIDPITESQEHQSTYQYSWNNPILRSDPNGDFPFVIPLLPYIAAATVEVMTVVGELAVGAYIANEFTDLAKKVGAGGAYSPAVGFAMSASSPGDLTNGKVGLNNSKANAATERNSDKEKKPSKAEERAAKLSKKDRPGEDFTKAGKEAVINLNKEKNNGKTVCVGCGIETIPAKQDKRGVAPPSNRTEVDHRKRKREGGSGTPDNGDLLCRGCNNKKQ
jgi:RHS repeat-associated protein